MTETKKDRAERAKRVGLGVAAASVVPIAVNTGAVSWMRRMDSNDLAERRANPQAAALRNKYVSTILRDAKKRGVTWMPAPNGDSFFGVLPEDVPVERKSARGLPSLFSFLRPPKTPSVPGRRTTPFVVKAGPKIITPRRATLAIMAHEAGHSMGKVLPLQFGRRVLPQTYLMGLGAAGVSAGLLGTAERRGRDSGMYKKQDALALGLSAAPLALHTPVILEELRANKNAWGLLRRAGMSRGAAAKEMLKLIPGLTSYVAPAAALLPYAISKHYVNKYHPKQEQGGLDKTAGLPRHLKEMYRARVAAAAIDPKSTTAFQKWTQAYPTNAVRAPGAAPDTNARLLAHLAGKSGKAGAPSLVGQVARGSSKMDRHIRSDANNAMQSYADFIKEWRNQPPPTIRQRLVEFITDPFGYTQYPRGVKRGTPPPGGWEVSQVGS